MNYLYTPLVAYNFHSDTEYVPRWWPASLFLSDGDTAIMGKVKDKQARWCVEKHRAAPRDVRNKNPMRDLYLAGRPFIHYHASVFDLRDGSEKGDDWRVIISP